MRKMFAVLILGVSFVPLLPAAAFATELLLVNSFPIPGTNSIYRGFSKCMDEITITFVDGQEYIVPKRGRDDEITRFGERIFRVNVRPVNEQNKRPRIKKATCGDQPMELPETGAAVLPQGLFGTSLLVFGGLLVVLGRHRRTGARRR